jgi:GntR family transcriptional regulator
MAKAPMYAEIKDWILDQIERGAFPEGSRLTPEVELAERFGVSRPTVRQAILELARDGIVARRRGGGTLVVAQRMAYPVGRLMSFSEEFAASGSRTSSRVLFAGVVRADADIAVRLGVAHGTDVFRLDRVREVDDAPAAWQRSHIGHARVPHIAMVDFAASSLYRVLRERYGFLITSADEVIRAGIAVKADADLLDVTEGSPVFRIERRSFTASGELIELVDSVYRSDRYEIRLRLRR